jgi:uncharacterized protein
MRRFYIFMRIMKKSRYFNGFLRSFALPACLVATGIFLTPISYAAQDKAASLTDADPALWVVKDDDTTIYLFGTIHVLKPGLSWFDEAVRDAFNASDSLVVEMVDPAEEEMFSTLEKYAIDKSGKTLRSKLTPKQQKSYAATLKKLAVPLNEFDPLNPWFAAINIEMMNLTARGYSADSGVETILEAEAKAAKKPILELESFAEQLQLMHGLPKSSQMELLVTSFDSVTAKDDELGVLVDQWAKSDLNGLAKSMNDGLNDPVLRDTMLTKRNANWAAWINTRMAKPGTVFLAVGAGHLSGDDSVQIMLQRYKHEAKQIAY